MRSRYCAYAKGLDEYILATWQLGTRPSEIAADGELPLRWVGLEVLRHEVSGDQALVEFVARYKRNGRAGRMHEISRFIRQNGHWLYVNGDPGG